MKWGVCLTSTSASCPLLQIGQKHAVCPSMRCSLAGFTRRCRSMLASRFIIGWKNMFSVCIKKDRRRCAKLFSVLPVSDAFDSIILAKLTYARALPLPPSSCCPLFLFLHLLFKKNSRRCDKLFSVLPSLQDPQFPYCWRDLLIRGRYRYLHRRAVFYSFCFYICCFISSETSPCGSV